MAAVVEVEPVFSIDFVLEEVGGRGETEEVGRNEVHGCGVPYFVNVDWL